jgi:hypothetical protein
MYRGFDLGEDAIDWSWVASSPKLREKVETEMYGRRSLSKLEVA